MIGVINGGHGYMDNHGFGLFGMNGTGQKYLRGAWINDMDGHDKG